MIWNAKAVNHSSKCNPGRQIFAFELSLYLGSRRSRGFCDYNSLSPLVNETPQADASVGAHESSVLTAIGESIQAGILSRIDRGIDNGNHATSEFPPVRTVGPGLRVGGRGVPACRSASGFWAPARQDVCRWGPSISTDRCRDTCGRRTWVLSLSLYPWTASTLISLVPRLADLGLSLPPGVVADHTLGEKTRRGCRRAGMSAYRSDPVCCVGQEAALKPSLCINSEPCRQPYDVIPFFQYRACRGFSIDPVGAPPCALTPVSRPIR
jgi:hypothetical protein